MSDSACNRYTRNASGYKSLHAGMSNPDLSLAINLMSICQRGELAMAEQKQLGTTSVGWSRSNRAVDQILQQSLKLAD